MLLRSIIRRETPDKSPDDMALNSKHLYESVITPTPAGCRIRGPSTPMVEGLGRPAAPAVGHDAHADVYFNPLAL